MTAAVSTKGYNAAITGDAVSALIADRLGKVAAQAPAALREAARAHLCTSSKKIRGRLAFAVLHESGCDDSRALDWATAVELLHNASLVHDDVCDRDTHRRHQQTIHKQFGEAVAICLGDCLIAIAYEICAELKPTLVGKASESIRNLAGGQAGEFTHTGYPDWETYQSMATQKTAPLLALPITGGADILDIPLSNADAGHYFNNAALCFQILNDLGNFSGTDGANDPCSDLANGRPNAVLACFKDLLNRESQARFDLWTDKIRAGELIADTVETRQWWHKVRQSYAFADTSQRLHFHFNEASKSLFKLPPPIRAAIVPLQQWLAKEVTHVQQQGGRCKIPT